MRFTSCSSMRDRRSRAIPEQAEIALRSLRVGNLGPAQRVTKFILGNGGDACCVRELAPTCHGICGGQSSGVQDGVDSTVEPTSGNDVIVTIGRRVCGCIGLTLGWS